MKKIIVYNWLILAVSALLTSLYIGIFEHFWADKAYMYLILAIGFGVIYYKQRKSLK